MIKATLAFLFSAISFVIAADFFTGMKIHLPNFPWTNIYTSGLCLLLSIVFSSAVTSQIKKNRTYSKAMLLVIPALIMNLLVILVVFAVLAFNTQIKKLIYGGGRIEAITARQNLRILYRYMRMYADTFDGRYPVPYEWCDLLVEHCRVDAGYFGSPYNEGPRSYHTTDPNTDPNVSMNFAFGYEYLNSQGVQEYVYRMKISAYAINPECCPNSPRETILLFGAEDGWNQYGGPELMKFEHAKGRRCVVLRNDGKIGFVRPDDVGKLIWNVGSQ